jgi:hypothetical protein
MKRIRLFLLSGAAAAALAFPGRADDVAVFRIADEGSLRVSAARATRGPVPAATVVVVLETGRGARLFLRRAPAESGATVYEAWLGGPPGVTFTRRGDAFLLQAGGRSLSVVEADLARPTVRCWVSTLVSRAEPKLLEAASDVRLLKEWAGGPALDDVYTPMQLLWQVAEPSEIRPRGAAKLEKGPFTGETWDRLRRAASDELGKR